MITERKPRFETNIAAFSTLVAEPLANYIRPQIIRDHGDHARVWLTEGERDTIQILTPVPVNVAWLKEQAEEWIAMQVTHALTDSTIKTTSFWMDFKVFVRKWTTAYPEAAGNKREGLYFRREMDYRKTSPVADAIEALYEARDWLREARMQRDLESDSMSDQYDPKRDADLCMLDDIAQELYAYHYEL